MEEKSINLIIVDDTFDSEQRIVSALRAQGYVARSQRSEDEEDLGEALDKQPRDLLLYFMGMELISLTQTCQLLQAHKNGRLCRVIAVRRDACDDSVADVMRAGAVDLVDYNDIDHLVMVIDREYRALKNARAIDRLEKALHETELRCNSLLDSSRDAIAYIHEGMHVYSNQSYLEMFGIEASEDLEGLPILDMVAEEQRDTFKAFLRNYSRSSDGVQSLQTLLRKPDGEEFDGEMELSPAQIDNEPCIQIIIRQQSGNNEELEEQLRLLSQKDQLTGIYNRQYFIEALENVIVGCEQGGQTAAIMEIALDNFDSIKETAGITEADNYIAAAAQCLNDCLDDGMILARYTHATFACIAIDHDHKATQQLGQRFQQAISDLVYGDEATGINTTCSIGAALIDKNAPEYNTILSRAEKALAEAREQGVNQLCIHEPEKGELTRQEADKQFREQITHALKNDDFVLFFQPIISLHGDTEERYEVFVRMKNTEAGDGSLIPPQEFLPAAERIGMATAIDRWVLHQTINHILARQAEGKTTRFFLKLTSASLKDETLLDWLDYQVKERKIPANTLSFVVKESIAVTNLRHTRELSRHLRKIHCGFILDDFGSGTNPFQLLQHIHCDYIRIDPAYMEDIGENPQNQEHIKMIADQASEIGKLTIAQHVPDAASLSILWGMGINFIQGHFLQEPLPNLDYDFSEMSG